MCLFDSFPKANLLIDIPRLFIYICANEKLFSDLSQVFKRIVFLADDEGCYYFRLIRLASLSASVAGSTPRGNWGQWARRFWSVQPGNPQKLR